MIVVVSCFWNAENYIEKCINSVKSQNFSDFKMFLIDDMSTDNTVEKIKNLIKNDERFVLLLNEEKKFKLKNMNELIKNKVLINDEDIIVELDGDDWLHNSNVLNLINKKYTENKDKDNYMNPDHTVKPLNHYGTGTVFFSLNTQEKNQLSKFDKVNFKLNSLSNGASQ